MSIKSKQEFTNYFVTLTTIIFAITSLITIYISISAMKEKRESLRPYITFVKSPIVTISHNDDYELIFVFTLGNVGQHPVAALHIQTIIIDTKLDKEPLHTDQFTFLNNITQNDTKELKIIIEDIDKSAIKEHYIVMNLKYNDPIFEKTHEQIYYLKWYGIENGLPQQIYHASKEDKDKIVNYLKKL